MAVTSKRGRGFMHPVNHPGLNLTIPPTLIIGVGLFVYISFDIFIELKILNVAKNGLILWI